jgi:hypothetical protein
VATTALALHAEARVLDRAALELVAGELALEARLILGRELDDQGHLRHGRILAPRGDARKDLYSLRLELP